MAAGDPARRGQQRRPGPGQPRPRARSGRIPAQPEPVLLPPRQHPRQRHHLVPGLLDAGLADVPDALAAAPSGGRLLALLTDGTTELSAPGASAWTTLATHHALAASAAATRCGLGNLTAAAFSPSGSPLLAANCTRPGTAGIFAYASGTWHPAGPALPAAYAHQTVTVLRLTTTTGTTTALLATGTGPTAHLLAAWSTDGGAHWSLSQPLPLGDAKLTIASFGPSTAAIILTGNRAQTITGTARSWQPLPTLPPGTATLAPGTAGGWDALTVHRTKLTIWQLAPGARTWASHPGHQRPHPVRVIRLTRPDAISPVRHRLPTRKTAAA